MAHEAATYAAALASTVKTPTQTKAVVDGRRTARQAKYDESQAATAAQVQEALDYEEPPSITSISPTSFSAGTGVATVTIVITGNGFTGASGVKLGAVAASSVTITDDLHITAVFPRPVATANLNVVVSKRDKVTNAVVYAFTLT